MKLKKLVATSEIQDDETRRRFSIVLITALKTAETPIESKLEAITVDRLCPLGRKIQPKIRGRNSIGINMFAARSLQSNFRESSKTKFARETKSKAATINRVCSSEGPRRSRTNGGANWNPKSRPIRPLKIDK